MMLFHRLESGPLQIYRKIRFQSDAVHLMGGPCSDQSDRFFQL